MVEIERIKNADSAAQGFKAIRKRLDHLVTEDIIPPVSSIDNGNWDGYVFKDGKWMEHEKAYDGD